MIVPRPDSREDALRARFAPPERVLASAYDATSLAFVLLARSKAPIDPSLQELLGWAKHATSPDARTGVLRFLLEGQCRDAMLKALLAAPPAWMLPLDGLAAGKLTDGWNAYDRQQLQSKLRADAQRALHSNDIYQDTTAHTRSPPHALEAIWLWWDENRHEAIPKYECGIYPADFRPSDLTRSTNSMDLGDREGWFTLLALACFQGFGGAQDGQHRTFIADRGRDWWKELAQAAPGQEDHAWLERLRDWSGAKQADLDYWRWRRTLVDLYRIARWLPRYAWMFSVLPRAVRQAGTPGLKDILTPSFSPVWRQAGIEAAPLPRSLGLGANWAVRELLRAGFWTDDEAEVMAPYAWASTGRVRRLLNGLRADLGDRADMDLSHRIWDFVLGQIPHRRADILRDGDLPLQIIPRADRASERASGPRGLPLDPWEESADEDEDEDGLVREAAE